MTTTGVPYLGSKISLVSKADIRYEGILYTIDPNECTVALAKVRSFGTEERPTDRPVLARDDVFEYIIFRGSDIKDLNVCEPPRAQLTLAHLQDPAIVKQSGPVVSSASRQPAFGAESSAPLVPAVSAALNGALGIQTASHQYVKTKLGEIVPRISKKSPPPPLHTVPPKSPVPESPTKPDAPPVSRARRSPGSRRRGTGSGRVIPTSPKEALLAELMGPSAARPVEAAKAVPELAAAAPPSAAAAAFCTVSAAPPTAPASGSEGSPSKGRRRRRNGATLRTSAQSAPPANVVPLIPHVATTPVAPVPVPVVAAMAPPTGPPPVVVSAPKETKEQRSPRRIKATRRRGTRLSSSKDDSRVASAAVNAPSQFEAHEFQPPTSTSTPAATAPSRGRNVASNTSISRGSRGGRGAVRGSSLPHVGRGGAPNLGRGAASLGRGGASRQPNAHKQTYTGPGFQTNYFQGFQAGFEQALQQAYFNASVSGLFNSPVRGGFRGRGRGRGLSRGAPAYTPRGGAAAYTPRGGAHHAGNAAYANNYGTGYAPRHPGNYPPAPPHVRSFDPCAFVGDYDFEEANSKFDKGKVQEEFHYGHLEATGNPEKDRENAEASKDSAAAAALKAAVKEAAASLEHSAGAAAAPSEYSPGVYNVNGDFFYDKTKSFYDKISCTSVDKMQHYAQPVVQQAPVAGNRVTWREARALNSETFGVPSVAAARRFVQGGVPPSQAHLYRISPSPRGRGARGFFQRGRGWSPRVRGGGWAGRGRGGYHPNSYYAGHINDYHGTDPSQHLTAALAAAAAAALPQKAYSTTPLVDAKVHLSLPDKQAVPTTPLAQSRLILEPTPSNTPIALPPITSVISEEIAASKLASTSGSSSTTPTVVLSKASPSVSPSTSDGSMDEVVVCAVDVAAAAAAPSENIQEAVLKELQEAAAAAALPPPPSEATVA